jgi:hypothetical protein
MIEPADIHAGRQLAHHARRRRDLGHRLALHAQRDQKAGDLRRGRPAGHDGAHDRGHLVAGQITMLQAAVDRLFQLHD